MTETTGTERPFVGTIDTDGRRYAVDIEIRFDGVEYIGFLHFAEYEWESDDGIADEVGITGRSPNEVLQAARALSSDELSQRYVRARSNTRRFHDLRKATDSVLTHIRHLAKVSISMRAGLLGVDEAAREIDATEQRLLDMVRQLRGFVGVAS